MVFYKLCFNGQEGSIPYMQRYLRDVGSTLAQCVESPLREMQTGGGGRDRPGIFRVNGLVSLQILRVFISPFFLFMYGGRGALPNFSRKVSNPVSG